jgi:hypothetical protein
MTGADVTTPQTLIEAGDVDAGMHLKIENDNIVLLIGSATISVLSRPILPSTFYGIVLELVPENYFSLYMLEGKSYTEIYERDLVARQDTTLPVWANTGACGVGYPLLGALGPLTEKFHGTLTAPVITDGLTADPNKTPGFLYRKLRTKTWTKDGIGLGAKQTTTNAYIAGSFTCTDIASLSTVFKIGSSANGMHLRVVKGLLEVLIGSTNSRGRIFAPIRSNTLYYFCVLIDMTTTPGKTVKLYLSDTRTGILSLKESDEVSTGTFTNITWTDTDSVSIGRVTGRSFGVGGPISGSVGPIHYFQ